MRLIKLIVSGIARLTGPLHDSTDDPGTAGQVLSSTVTGVDWITAPGTGTVTGTGTTGKIPKWASASSLADSVVTEASGKIGINVSPAVDLHVQENSSSTEPAAEVENLGAGDAAYMVSVPATSWAFGCNNSNGDRFTIAFGSGAGTATLDTTAYFHIGGDGKVGVGPGGINPQTILHASENTSSTVPTLELQQLGSGDAGIQASRPSHAYALGIDGTDEAFKICYAAGSGTAVLGTNTFLEISTAGAITIPQDVNLTAGAATAAIAQRFGASRTEGMEVRVIDEDVTLGAIENDLTQDIPSDSVILCAQLNNEGGLTGGGTTNAVALGITADPDKYSPAGGTALTKNSKTSQMVGWAVLTGNEDIRVNAITAGGALGDTALTGGPVRVRILFLAFNHLDDAP